MVTRLGFQRISHIESRIALSYRAAAAVRGTPGKATILLVGNSLPLEGINIPHLQRALGSSTTCVPFFIEQTQYLDWYYGMRRLFAQGSHPDVMVLSMNVGHLLASAIRGDYSAYYLFRASDIPAVAHEAGYDLTKTSSLLLSHYSLFYAGRTPLRNFLLNKIDRPYGDFLHALTTHPAPAASAGKVEEIATSRLKDLRTEAEAHGVRFVFLLPPGSGPEEPALVRSAERAGVELVIPVHLNEFDSGKFSDGFHLNEEGSEIFTARLSESLQRYLAKVPTK
jgi:hypothetical protein